MNVRDYITKIKRMQSDLPASLRENVYPDISDRTVKRMKRRIFTNGLATDESEIGEYSEKPITASREAFVKKSAFIPTKKGGKSMRLKGGYKELKQIQGLKATPVNLQYSGSLRESIQKQETETGFQIGFTDVENSDKAKNLESKYSKRIFALSEDEKLKMARETATAVRRIYKSYFYAN